MTTLLYVYDDGDYGAMTFEQQYNAQEVYAQMVADGVTTLNLPDKEYPETCITVEIRKFGEVDPKFIAFIEDKFIDYDFAKAENYYVIKEDD